MAELFNQTNLIYYLILNIFAFYTSVLHGQYVLKKFYFIEIFRVQFFMVINQTINRHSSKFHEI